LVKNITIIGINYFPEDSAIGLYSTQMSEYFASIGYNVTVITGFPYYPQWAISKSYKSKPYFASEIINSVLVLRSKQYVPSNPTFFKRVLHLISFTLGSFINLFKTPKPDLVISIIPFTSSVLLGWFLKLIYSSKLWVHVQDFEFDAAVQSGISSKTSLFFKILFSVEKKLLGCADIVSTISLGMLRKLSQKTNRETYFFPNWIDLKNNTSHPVQHPFLRSKKTKILYSGNIGEKQDWNNFIAFCKDTAFLGYEIIIVGDGAKKDWLLDEIKALKHVFYHQPIPYEELSSLLSSADLHVLFQKVDVIDTVMPSKILGMMASGKPSMIIGNTDSEVRQIFQRSNSGLFFTAYTNQVIASIESLLKDSPKCLEMGSAARDYVLSNFSKQEILGGMSQRIKELLNSD
jgi:colanic acid biosynthesis glycosyl transferase WcaI